MAGRVKPRAWSIPTSRTRAANAAYMVLRPPRMPPEAMRTAVTMTMMPDRAVERGDGCVVVALADRGDLEIESALGEQVGVGKARVPPSVTITQESVPSGWSRSGDR
jgi:hypothetical protein